MALSSRKKRRAFRNPKRVRRGGSTGFNLAVVAILVLGTVLVFVSRHPSSAGAVGPKLHNSANQDDAADHWHAAIGVNVCGTWEPAPIWSHFTSGGSPARANEPGVYAGLHSHQLSNGQGDGIIHMEPATTDEAGRNATVGKWIQFGGWHLSATSMSLWTGSNGKPIKESNGNKCGKQSGELRWAVGQFTQGKTTVLTTHTGDPAHFKLYNDNVIAIYFGPASQNLKKLGSVPSEANLPDAASNNGNATTPTSTGTATTVPGVTTTVKPGSAASTTAPVATTTPTTSTPTTAPTSTTPTTTKP
ncbi:MAG TPA: hypothetical protein VGO03_03170 [Acidimicrobiia bacterium]|jgi:hypothetical protein